MAESNGSWVVSHRHTHPLTKFEFATILTIVDYDVPIDAVEDQLVTDIENGDFSVEGKNPSVLWVRHIGRVKNNVGERNQLFVAVIISDHQNP